MTRKPLLDLLRSAYAAELETVQNYLAIVEALAAAVLEELGHAEKLAHRMEQLGVCPPGSLGRTRDPSVFQPATHPTDLLDVVKGVVAAERAAIATYHEMIAVYDDNDPVTADLAGRILADEEAHCGVFHDFLRSLEKDPTG